MIFCQIFAKSFVFAKIFASSRNFQMKALSPLCIQKISLLKEFLAGFHHDPGKKWKEKETFCWAIGLGWRLPGRVSSGSSSLFSPKYLFSLKFLRKYVYDQSKCARQLLSRKLKKLVDFRSLEIFVSTLVAAQCTYPNPFTYFQWPVLKIPTLFSPDV